MGGVGAGGVIEHKWWRDPRKGMDTVLDTVCCTRIYIGARVAGFFLKKHNIRARVAGIFLKKHSDSDSRRCNVNLIAPCTN